MDSGAGELYLLTGGRGNPYFDDLAHENSVVLVHHGHGSHMQSQLFRSV